MASELLRSCCALALIVSTVAPERGLAGPFKGHPYQDRHASLRSGLADSGRLSGDVPAVAPAGMPHPDVAWRSDAAGNRASDDCFNEECRGGGEPSSAARSRNCPPVTNAVLKVRVPDDVDLQINGK